MAIKSVFFTGETLPPHMLANPIAALEQLNEWRDQNPSFNGVNTTFSQATIALGFLNSAYGSTTPGGLLKPSLLTEGNRCSQN